MKNVKSIKKNVKKVQRMWGLILIFNFDMFFSKYFIKCE